MSEPVDTSRDHVEGLALLCGVLRPAEFTREGMDTIAATLRALLAERDRLAAGLAVQVMEHWHTWRVGRGVVDGSEHALAQFKRLPAVIDAITLVGDLPR